MEWHAVGAALAHDVSARNAGSRHGLRRGARRGRDVWRYTFPRVYQSNVGLERNHVGAARAASAAAAHVRPRAPRSMVRATRPCSLVGTRPRAVAHKHGYGTGQRGLCEQAEALPHGRAWLSLSMPHGMKCCSLVASPTPGCKATRGYGTERCGRNARLPPHPRRDTHTR